MVEKFFWRAPLAIIPILSGWIGAAEEPPRKEDLAETRGLIAAWVSDAEGSMVTGGGKDLKVTAFIIPDALAFKVAKEYLGRLEAGDSHDGAVKKIAEMDLSWKLREGRSAVRLGIEGSRPPPGIPPETLPIRRQRVFTFEKRFPQDAVSLFGAEGKPIPSKLAEAPKNLRAAQLQIKKFWVAGDGTTGRGAYDPGEPASIGRKPKLSNPFPAILLESKPAEVELLFKAKSPKALPQRLTLKDFKVYEGPFENDQLDLNSGRRWDPVEAVVLDLRPPPSGLEIPSILQRLVREVKEASALATPQDRKKK